MLWSTASNSGIFPISGLLRNPVVETGGESLTLKIPSRCEADSDIDAI